MKNRLTGRQKEVLEYFENATSEQTAEKPFGADAQVARNLAKKGILNYSWSTCKFWIRQPNEPATGFYYAHDLVVMLRTELLQPNDTLLGYIVLRAKYNFWHKEIVPCLRNLLRTYNLGIKDIIEIYSEPYGSRDTHKYIVHEFDGLRT